MFFSLSYICVRNLFLLSILSYTLRDEFFYFFSKKLNEKEIWDTFEDALKARAPIPITVDAH